jgi:hypothetical protein
VAFFLAGVQLAMAAVAILTLHLPTTVVLVAVPFALGVLGVGIGVLDSPAWAPHYPENARRSARALGRDRGPRGDEPVAGREETQP